MRQVASQKNGVSALGLQRALGLGNYKTAWAMLHKLRRAMVRPGRDRLSGVVEVDEAYWGAEEAGVRGRQSIRKALIIVATQADGQDIGRIRFRHIQDTNRATLHGFIAESIGAGSTVVSDGLQAYRELEGYVHDWQIQKHQPADGTPLLPRVHRVISLLKRWLLGTHQGAVAHAYLQDYLDEFTFRFNRRKSSSRGSCSTAWPNRPFRFRPFHSIHSRIAADSGWWSHVHSPISQKAVLEQKLTSLEMNQTNRLELMKAWILEANRANTLAFSGSASEMKWFLRKVGSNRVLRNQKLVTTFRKPWNYLAETVVWARSAEQNSDRSLEWWSRGESNP